MTRSRTASLALLSLGAAGSLAILTGCAFGDTINIETESRFDSTGELSANWDRSAPWLPGDATDILIREVRTADSAVLLAASATELDPALCVETDRLSAPMFTVDGAPDPYTDRAFACGAWTVIPTDDGWYGWTPSHPDEQAASDSIG